MCVCVCGVVVKIIISNEPKGNEEGGKSCQKWRKVKENMLLLEPRLFGLFPKCLLTPQPPFQPVGQLGFIYQVLFTGLASQFVNTKKGISIFGFITQRKLWKLRVVKEQCLVPIFDGLEHFKESVVGFLSLKAMMSPQRNMMSGCKKDQKAFENSQATLGGFLQC